MLAPCGSRTYSSWTNGYAWSDSAVTSSRPSSAQRFRVWMSFRTCSNSKSRVSISPDASAMVKKLAALGLAEPQPYGGVVLTPAGEQVALEVIRHHRLLELYLAQTLGVHVDDVHEEADRLEHVISEELEARIDRALGFPTHDPHGDPIPDAELNWPRNSPVG